MLGRAMPDRSMQMGEPTKAEMAGDITERLSKMEVTIGEARGAVGILKWMVGILIPSVIAGATAFALTFGGCIYQHGVAIGKNEEKGANLHAQLEKTEARILALEAERRFRNTQYGGLPESVTHQGKLVALGQNKITMALDGKETVFSFTEFTKFFVDSKEAKAEDIRPLTGAVAYFFLSPFDDSTITAINVLSPKK
jgi:hypothetical protein